MGWKRSYLRVGEIGIGEGELRGVWYIDEDWNRGLE
jgi:hypothetical protein